MKILKTLLLLSLLFFSIQLSEAKGFQLSPTTFCRNQRVLVNKYFHSLIYRGGSFSQGKALGGVVGIYQLGKGYCFFRLGKSKPHGKNDYTINSIFELASITKIFTTAIMGIKQHEKEIDVTAPIPENDLPVGFNLQPSMQSVTFQQLATFSGGFNFNDPPNFRLRRPYSEQQFMSVINKLVPTNSIYGQSSEKLPTINFYSNSSIGFLGQILMNIDLRSSNDSFHFSPKTFNQWIHNYITGPLKMNNTSALEPKLVPGYAYVNGMFKARAPFPFTPWAAAGALRTNVHDMLIFIKNILCAYSPDSKGCVAPLSSKIIAFRQGIVLAQTGQNYIPDNPPNYLKNVPMTPNGIPFLNAQQAYAWVIQSNPTKTSTIIYKDGDHPGFTSWIGLNLTKSYGIILLLNTGKVRLKGAPARLLFNLP